MGALEEVLAHIDTAWTAHARARTPLHDQLSSLVASLEGTSGLQPGPGAENLIQRFLDFAENNTDAIAEAALAKSDALVAQEERDRLQAEAAQTAPRPPPPDSLLLSLPGSDARAWLKNVNDADLTRELEALPTPQERADWAAKMFQFAREDGNQAQVLEALNKVKADAVAAGATDPAPTGIPASPPPVAGDMPTDIALLMAWVGTDVDRARQAYDVEVAHAGGPREDVMAYLVHLLDQPHVAAVDAPLPADTGAPQEPAPPATPETPPLGT